MATTIIKGMILSGVYFFISYTLIFIVMHLSGGSPFPSDLPISTESYQQLYSSFYLDRPRYEQYYRYLYDILALNWGYSFSNAWIPLTALLPQALLPTLVLAISAIVLALPSALLLVIMAYFSPHHFLRKVFITIIHLINSLPTIILTPALFLTLTIYAPQLFLAQSQWYHIPWFFIIIAILALPYSAIFAKLLYTDLRFHQNNHYAQQLQALGFSLPRILWFLRFQLFIPINKFSGTALAQLLSGSIFVEEFFRIPGLGSLSVTALHHRDYPVILLTSLLFSLMLLLLTSLNRYLHSRLDPRMQGDNNEA